MGRLIGFILIFAVFLVFIVLNLENRCDISFGFITVETVPVFITAFISFFVGMICAIPFFASFNKRKKQLPGAPGAAAPEKRWGRKNKPPMETLPGQDGPYGVD
jgi:uncharacterized membrane protein YciS (DUF1049 family)